MLFSRLLAVFVPLSESRQNLQRGTVETGVIFSWKGIAFFSNCGYDIPVNKLTKT